MAETTIYRQTYEQLSLSIVRKSEYLRLRRIWIPAYAGMTATVGFTLLKMVF
ncbi:MAG: hypothetical protein LBQ52_10210 [Helicobacteraceae bacterium]|nr:hypothetical protein [Helicobacteraceae bacterium]